MSSNNLLSLAGWTFLPNVSCLLKEYWNTNDHSNMYVVAL